MIDIDKILVILLAACAASVFTITRIKKQHPMISVYWALVWLYWIARCIHQEGL